MAAYLEDGGFTGDGWAGGKRPFSAGRYRSPRWRWGQDVPQGTLYAPAQNRRNRPPNGLQGPRSGRAGWSVRSWPTASATPAAGWWALRRWSRPGVRGPGAGPAGVPPLARGRDSPSRFHSSSSAARVRPTPACGQSPPFPLLGAGPGIACSSAPMPAMKGRSGPASAVGSISSSQMRSK